MFSLQTVDLAVGNRQQPRLAGVTTVLKPGEMVAILGPNGAGKSTLLRCLAGITPPSRGSVLLNGLPLAKTKHPARVPHLAFLPQTTTIRFRFTVRELVALGSADPGRCERALAAVDLADRADASLLSLSGGEAQRASLARVFAQDSTFFLLDEPLAHLDLRHQLLLLATLQEKSTQGHGVVVVLHDLTLALRHFTRVILLHEGHVVGNESPRRVLTHETLRAVFGVRWREGDPMLVDYLAL